MPLPKDRWVRAALLRPRKNHVRRVLTTYSAYYNETRTHLGLDKDTPLPRPAQRSGPIVSVPILSGPHHCYART